MCAVDDDQMTRMLETGLYRVLQQTSNKEIFLWPIKGLLWGPTNRGFLWGQSRVSVQGFLRHVSSLIAEAYVGDPKPYTVTQGLGFRA